MDLPQAFYNIKHKYGTTTGSLRDQEQVWTYYGLSQRSRTSMDLSLAFSEVERKITGFLRDQEKVWIYHGLSLRSRARKDLS